MKVSAILTVASLFLAGLVVAVPIISSLESGINIHDEKRVKQIDSAYFLSLIEAIYQSRKTGDNSSIPKIDEKELFNQPLAGISENDLKDRFIDKFVGALQSQEVETSGIHKREVIIFGKTADKVLGFLFVEMPDLIKEKSEAAYQRIVNFYKDGNLAAKPGLCQASSKKD